MMTLTDGLLLASAAFAAGVLNAIAGGGSFLTFPALVFTGVNPSVANATSGAQSIANVVSMGSTAPDGCQGVTFTIALTLTGSQS